MTFAIILAAGSGSRMARATGGTRKQFLNYRGAPLFWHSAVTFSRVARISGVVFVFPPQEFDAGRAMVLELNGQGPGKLGLAVHFAPGGERRQDSVRHGLEALPRDCQHVLVHDAARPFASAGLTESLLDALANVPGAIPAMAVTDTIKRVDGTLVRETLKRSELVAVQTPQAFDAAVLAQAHTQALAGGWEVTDDASILERAGHPVAVVEGEACNIKITHPEDLRLLEQEDAPVPIPVTGFGYDVHAYAHAKKNPKQPARPLMLGGVAIPGGPEVLAHSDGDVLLHALTDAILGCIGKGDIGGLFPDNDDRFDNASSGMMLAEVLELAATEGLSLAHADITIIAQTPRVGPHKDAIRASVAQLLGLPAARVNLKATTEEGLGFTGRKEGIKAVAVVTGMLAG